ncbi:hypothetical protein FH609_024460 [Streptomyces sp. 3MP-14]|uniref:Uncharacterized protein n=1 Tax=Streptomyces mimosae TaxID=2586635 RepID=A0A5N6A2M6_9ACTN|nr:MULTISPECIES: hypothetical protein [Streptomyces]KAB8162219.1 hypothetical protein FH607_022275 [Streptomyces mimosae]KAB8173882.1 hypothetical protein FH609_024460 [Streptomyces sp. 3MP-14]
MTLERSSRLFPFPEERVLEHAAFGEGVVPLRLHGLLLPVWEVEVEADITEGEKFSLLERFLARGLRHGGLHGIDELTAFFALDRALVAQAVRALTAIGHVREEGGRLTLTGLGQRSVDDDTRYVLTRQDRRKLYFEALSSVPLQKPHYDQETVSLLSEEELGRLVGDGKGPRFTPLFVSRSFDPAALDDLNRRRDRARYNLPVAMDRMRTLDSRLVYLPLYVVSARGRLLAYGQAGAGAAHDGELSDLLTKAPSVAMTLENEQIEDEERTLKGIENWLHRHGLPPTAPEREGGTWRISLPPEAFRDEHKLSLSRIGSYQIVGARFFRLWCGDENHRKRALLVRLDQRFGARWRVDRATAEAIVAQLARQLALAVPDLSSLRTGAGRMGLAGLESQLARLEKEPR